MTALPLPVRLCTFLLALALTLVACSSDTSTEDALGVGPLPAKEAPELVGPEAPDADDEAHDADEADDERDESTDVTTPEPEDETTEPEDPPVSPPGTVNDLEDLIGNEGDDGSLQRTDDNTLVDRFVTVLLETDNGDDEVSEADARCAAEMLDEQLSSTSFELLVVNLETINEIEDGEQFTEAELTVISESFANCLDLRTLVDDVVSDDVDLGSLVSCLAADIGVDGVEALLLFEVLGENADRLTTPIFLVGLELCPSEARDAIDAAILDQFLLADAPKIEACLAGISSAELRPFFETREFSELIRELRDQCLF